MTERDIGLEILEGIREIKAFKRGEIQGLRMRELKHHAPPEEIRSRLKLSQAAFAGLMGVSVRTIQDWEQGRREPSGPAKSLLRIADQHPEVFMELV
ncbi:MAG: helix-turn-helix domain-containing protein [Candidatus Promineofilum sp.]|nr:helix-turn-helix domain-containing protein [Promineifilum sp.]MCW5863153.1 helix-turn-helix domain-containing protein [Anaerolineae bacterium]